MCISCHSIVKICYLTRISLIQGFTHLSAMFSDIFFSQKNNDSWHKWIKILCHKLYGNVWGRRALLDLFLFSNKLVNDNSFSSSAFILGGWQPLLLQMEWKGRKVTFSQFHLYFLSQWVHQQKPEIFSSSIVLCAQYNSLQAIHFFFFYWRIDDGSSLWASFVGGVQKT